MTTIFRRFSGNAEGQPIRAGLGREPPCKSGPVPLRYLSASYRRRWSTRRGVGRRALADIFASETLAAAFGYSGDVVTLGCPATTSWRRGTGKAGHDGWGEFGHHPGEDRGYVRPTSRDDARTSLITIHWYSWITSGRGHPLGSNHV